MKTRKRTIIILAVMIFAALIIWLIWGNTALTVTEIKLQSADLPESFSGFRIAQISDLHNASFGENNEKLLSLLEESEPDIIVITGDLVDSRNTDIEVGISLAEQAAQLAPSYYVTGNHEARISGYDELKTGLEAAGVSVLENERAELERNGEKLTLIGVDDPSFLTDYLFGDSASVTAEALSKLIGETDSYTVLLSHRPELFSTYVESGVDLVFSGHAHGGQIRLPFVGGLAAPGQGFFPEYDSGLYTEGETSMIVSRGLGNSIIPLRVNNRPEIVVAELG